MRDYSRSVLSKPLLQWLRRRDWTRLGVSLTVKLETLNPVQYSAPALLYSGGTAMILQPRTIDLSNETQQLCKQGQHDLHNLLNSIRPNSLDHPGLGLEPGTLNQQRANNLLDNLPQHLDRPPAGTTQPLVFNSLHKRKILDNRPYCLSRPRVTGLALNLFHHEHAQSVVITDLDRPLETMSGGPEENENLLHQTRQLGGQGHRQQPQDKLLHNNNNDRPQRLDRPLAAQGRIHQRLFHSLNNKVKIDLRRHVLVHLALHDCKIPAKRQKAHARWLYIPFFLKLLS